GVNNAKLPFSAEKFQRNPDTAVQVFFHFSLVHAIGLYTKISQSRDFAMPNLFSVIVPPGLIDEICPILSHKITAMEKKPNRISVLGLGQMGMKIAQLYLAAGYEVRVWNRSD